MRTHTSSSVVLPDRIERYILGSRYGLRYMGYVGTQDNLVRR